MRQPSPATPTGASALPRGFTLVEILTAIVVLSILAAIVGPKMVALSSRTHAETAAQQVLGDLERARMEAIKRNTSVTWRKTGPDTYTITYVGARALDGATFQSAPDSVRFAPFGPLQLGAGSNFVVAAGGYTRKIVLTAAGHARIE